VIAGGHPEKGLAARLILEGVSARYPEASADALSGFSYNFEAGRIYCLAGPSGAGKSSVFNVILGLVKPTSGRVRFVAPAGDPRRLVTYMPQKVQLVPDSVAANVAYPETQFDRARVEQALVKVGLRDVVTSMPSGIDTLVGEGGRGLSGGQAQRLLLARLWYARAPFVLVDEGTSALDPELEGVVHGLLRELADQGAVVVTIAHRPAAAERADAVLRLDAGRLVPPNLA
jgi:ATP-binding cassette subfamily C protein CydD